MIFGQKWQVTLHIPEVPKILLKLLYLVHFLDNCTFEFNPEIQAGPQKW